MKFKYGLLCLFICFVLLPSFAAASNWILFASQQRNTINWYYEKDGLDASREVKLFFNLKIPLPANNIQKLWIKSSSEKGEKLYQAELKCRERVARLKDETGKPVYSDSSFDYLYDHTIPPDSVLDILVKTVCPKDFISY
jgi:hypothetical protein